MEYSAISLNASLSRQAGGVSITARRLCQALSVLEVDASAFGLEDEFTDLDRPQWEQTKTRVFRSGWPQSIGYSPPMTRALLASNAGLVHQHGLWMYPSIACLKWARRTGRPYIVSPHGMLDPWALANSRWKKRLAGGLFQNEHLKRAACLHALCESEVASFRAYGLCNPICVIPNGVDLPVSPSGIAPPWTVEVGTNRKVLLFLGRIHPKKGLRPLLDGWAQVCHRDSAVARDWSLVIAGWNQVGHEKELKQQARKLGLNCSVHFVGPLFDKHKAAALEHADAFVLPSFSEGLPMAVLEAWAYGLPVLITPQCNLPQGFKDRAALQIEVETQNIARGLSELLAMGDAERQAMGERGRALAARQFTWPIVAEQMKSVYEWVLGAGERPDCVQLGL